MRDYNTKNNKKTSAEKTKAASRRTSSKAKTTVKSKAKSTAKSKSAKDTKTAKTKAKPASRKNADRAVKADKDGRRTSRTTNKKAAVSKAKEVVKSALKAKRSSRVQDSLKIIPIGGLNEIGKNMTVLEYNDQILIIDCGMSFPDDGMYGIDVVIPDFTYLIDNAKKIVGLIITHGHEDHIGAVPYLLKQINVPVYGTPITLGLIKNKLNEHGIKGDLRVFNAGDTVRIGEYDVEVIRTTHSVADAVCFYIQTPAANLFHTGDFKIDYTPTDGEPIDLYKFAEIGERGVNIMLADSTNVLRPGFTKSERVVGETLDSIFREAKGRIVIATFSSNINRIRSIIELAHKYGRFFSVSGRSMENVLTLAQELGYIKAPRGSFVPLKQANNMPDEKMVILTTGSQGEPMSALARMANDEHRNVKLKKGDVVILSSTPVPGNEKSVSRVVNKLYEKDIKVIYNEILDIHVSGHACQEELKIIHSLIKPKFFMPAHGETRHLVEHGKLAESMGMSPGKVFVLSNGDQLSVNKRSAVHTKNVISAEDVMVDGLGIGDVGNAVLKERKQLSEAGLLMVSCVIDNGYLRLKSGPDVLTQGFVYVKENEKLLTDIKNLAKEYIEDTLFTGRYDPDDLSDGLKSEIRKYITVATKRSPVVLINIMEV